jgi:hypothetical protein
MQPSDQSAEHSISLVERARAADRPRLPDPTRWERADWVAVMALFSRPGRAIAQTVTGLTNQRSGSRDGKISSPLTISSPSGGSTVASPASGGLVLVSRDSNLRTLCGSNFS